MKSVLDIAGYFLFLGYRVVMLPIVSMLYFMLALMLGCQLVHALLQQLLKQFGRMAVAVGQLTKPRLQPGKKWQLGWHLNKAA